MPCQALLESGERTLLIDPSGLGSPCVPLHFVSVDTTAPHNLTLPPPYRCVPLNFVFVDTTGDGLTDALIADADGDGIGDSLVLDTSGDGLPDTAVCLIILHYHPP